MPNLTLSVRTDLDMTWQQYANCLGVDPELFFPADGGPNNSADAKAICARCVVRDECLEYAMAAPERWGTWGGLSESERREMRAAALRQRRRAELVARGVKVVNR